MSTSADRTYEQQNDSALDALYSKVSSLRSVTIDIHNDSENCNHYYENEKYDDEDNDTCVCVNRDTGCDGTGASR